MEGLATLILARTEQTPEDAAAGLGRLRWTNTGHPPPILLHADGTTEVLHTHPELLVGVHPDPARTHHDHPLPPGSTLLLYRRPHPSTADDLDDGIVRLRRTLTIHVDHTLDRLLDQLPPNWSATPRTTTARCSPSAPTPKTVPDHRASPADTPGSGTDPAGPMTPITTG